MEEVTEKADGQCVMLEDDTESVDIKQEILDGIYTLECAKKSAVLSRTAESFTCLRTKRKLLTRSKGLMSEMSEKSNDPIDGDGREMERLNNGEDDYTTTEVAFPSLPDNILKALGVFGSCDINKNLNEPDIEEQFARLSLAFKTDKFTLSKRLELQQRQRDIAEKNIESELKALRESLNALNQLCTDSDMREVITKTQQHVDIVQQATMRMSCRAETFGAIQQEQRMNCAFETMLSYVEHLKQIYDKEHIELEEYRRLLAENNLLPEEKCIVDGSEDTKRVLPPRSHSLSGTSKPEARARLLSAVCLLSNSDVARSGGNGFASPSPVATSPAKSRRSSLPVGPMTTAIHPVLTTIPSSPSLITNRSHENISEQPESSKQEDERAFNEITKISPLIRTESAESDSKSEEVKDSDSSQEILILPAKSDGNNKDSSDIKTTKSNSYQEDSNIITGNVYPMQESYYFNSNEVESEASATLECDNSNFIKKMDIMCFHKLRKWALEQNIWHWDSNAIFLHIRYLLSAFLAMAAMLSLILTFMPGHVAAYPYSTSCCSYKVSDTHSPVSLL